MAVGGNLRGRRVAVPFPVPVMKSNNTEINAKSLLTNEVIVKSWKFDFIGFGVCTQRY